MKVSSREITKHRLTRVIDMQNREDDILATAVHVPAELTSGTRATALQDSAYGGGVEYKAQRLSGMIVIHMTIITTPFLLSPPGSLALSQQKEEIIAERPRS